MPHRYVTEARPYEAVRVLAARFLLFAVLIELKLILKILPKDHPLRIFLSSRLENVIFPLVKKSAVPSAECRICKIKATLVSLAIAAAAGAPWLQDALGLAR